MIDTYKLLLKKFPRTNNVNQIIRGVFLVHHGSHDYKNLFDKATDIFRKHLLKKEFHTPINAVGKKIILDAELANELGLLVTEDEEKDVIAYAKFLLMEFHQTSSNF